MKKVFGLVLLWWVVLPSASPAIDLKQAKFTQVVNSVSVIAPGANTPQAAAVNDIFKTPDVLRTGPNSRAELVASDNTITRVGANTIFSYDPASRTLDLLQGSLLFHSPAGKGGGTIRTGSATASVLGTTILVASTPNGGFKLLDLEGQAEIRFLSGLHQTLLPGQMTFVLPGGGTSPVVVFRLDDAVNGSQLVNGFAAPLPSMPQINAQIVQQLLQILNNNLQGTGLIVGNNATPNSVQVSVQVQNPPPPPGGFNAPGQIVGSDRVSTLAVNYNPPTSPLDPNHVQTGSFSPPSTPSFTQGLEFLGNVNATPASGFVGSAIDIDTANIDLSAYATDDPNHPNFEIMASGDMRIWQSATFTGMSGVNDTVALLAGGQMLIAPGSDGHTVLEADTGIFGLVADSFGVLDTSTRPAGPNSLALDTLQNVDFKNTVGDIDILSLQQLTIYNSIISAAGIVSVESRDGSLTLGRLDDVNIYAGGDADLTSGATGTGSGGNVVVESSTLDAGYGGSSTGGSVNINAYNGNVTLNNVDVNAHNGSSTTAGNVSIYGSGTVNVAGTYIEADSKVTIESGGTLTLGSVNGNPTTSIQAGSLSLTSDNGDVDVNNYTITASSGSVDINPNAGSVDIENTSITDNGNSANGNIVIEDKGTGSGNIKVLASTITAQNGYVEFGGSEGVTIENNSNIRAVHGEGHVYSYGNMNVESSTIEAGGNVDIWGFASGNNVTINDSTVKSDTGDVNIQGVPQGQAPLGSVGMIGSTISAANGNVTITAGGNVDVEHTDVNQGGLATVNAAGNASLYDVYNNSIANFSAGDTYLTDWSITAGSYAHIYADGNVTIRNSSAIHAGGDADITSGGSVSSAGVSETADADGGNVDIENTTIYAGYNSTKSQNHSVSGGSVNINAYIGSVNNGNVYLSGDNINAYNGAVSIHGDGTAKLEGTSIYADNNVSIESGGTLTLGDVIGNTIEAGGSVNLTSDNSDVDINNYTITADSADATVTAGGGLDIENSTIAADHNVNMMFTGETGIKINGSTISGDPVAGTVGLTSDFGQTKILSGSLLTAFNIYINLPPNVDQPPTAGTGIEVDDSTISGDPVAGTISLNSASGETMIQNGSSLQAFYININSPDGILLDGTSGHISGNTMKLTAGMGNSDGGPTITVQNQNLGNLTILNVQSHTINFDNVTFGDRIIGNFTSFYGAFYVNDGHQVGCVNFNNDYYGNQAITTSSPGTPNTVDNGLINIVGAPSTSPGLHVINHN